MAKQLATTPTSILRLVPDKPNYIGYVDASGTTVGGVWTNGTKELPHQYVWRMKWPKDIQNNIVSKTDPKGTISIYNLEMAGVLLAWLILEKMVSNNLEHTHVGIFCDNQATVIWTNKHTTTTSIIASHLLRALAMRQHIMQASPLLTTHIEGNQNKIADMAASRSFNDSNFTKTNKPFLHTFNTLFPLQKDSWKEYTVPTKIFSQVISCLRGQPLAMELWTRTTKKGKNTGNTGHNMSKNTKQIHTSQTAAMWNKSSSPQHLLQGSRTATMAEEILSKFKPSKMHLLLSQRPLN